MGEISRKCRKRLKWSGLAMQREEDYVMDLKFGSTGARKRGRPKQ